MRKQIAMFLAAVAVQAAILMAVPARQVYTLTTGRTIRIKTAPVDPYDFLSGYHVVLNYEISRPEGWLQSEEQYDGGKTVYVVLKPGADGIWAAESVHDERPDEPGADAVVIKGRTEWRGIIYGVESYYIPEKARDRIDRDLREHAGTATAEITVDSFGNAALVRILIEDRVYEY